MDLSFVPTFGLSDDPLQHNLRQFTQFVREHETGLFNYIVRMVNDRQEAEDLTQDALLQAYKTWTRVEPDQSGAYVKWCYRIAHNLAIDFLRKKKPRAIDEEDLERAEDTRSLRPEEVYENRVQSSSVRESIAGLEEKYREVLILRYQEELSYEQIAEVLRVPVSTVETRIFRAKKMLREKLEK